MYDIRNPDDILDLLQQHVDGIPVSDISDCYATIEEDIKVVGLFRVCNLLFRIL